MTTNLSSILNNPNNFVLISFKITPKVIEILNLLQQYPDSLDQIITNIEPILQDGQITEKDIPTILLILVQLYHTNFKSIINLNLTSTDIIEFLKVLMKLIIEFNLIKVNNKEIIFIMIDSSSKLLETIIPPINLNNFSCFGCCE